MKTELTIFHSSSKKTDLSLKFILYGKKLTQTDTVKYLGRGGSKDFEKGAGGGGVLYVSTMVFRRKKN